MRQNTGAARGARIAIRLSQEDRVRIDEAVKARGYLVTAVLLKARRGSEQYQSINSRMA